MKEHNLEPLRLKGDRLDEAWDQGYRAAESGQDATQCPASGHEDMEREWRAGYEYCTAMQVRRKSRLKEI